MNPKMTFGAAKRALWDTVKTADDVTKVLDSLSAHVVFMDVEEPIKGAIFDALRSAVKAIQTNQ